jgi:hypothetical protein
VGMGQNLQDHICWMNISKLSVALRKPPGVFTSSKCSPGPRSKSSTKESPKEPPKVTKMHRTFTDQVERWGTVIG